MLGDFHVSGVEFGRVESVLDSRIWTRSLLGLWKAIFVFFLVGQMIFFVLKFSIFSLSSESGAGLSESRSLLKDLNKAG